MIIGPLPCRRLLFATAQSAANSVSFLLAKAKELDQKK